MSANDPKSPPPEQIPSDPESAASPDAAAPPEPPRDAPPSAPPPQAPPAAASDDAEARQWAMFIHLALFAGYVVPMAGLVLPIILWQVKKDELPAIDAHGKMVANWIISMVIYGVACFILLFVFIGLIGFFVLGVLSIVFPIIGAIKANDGVLWEYPLTLKLIK